ncbi:hypothetical protein QTP88_011829 [Uroleucon formosanum]
MNADDIENSNTTYKEPIVSATSTCLPVTEVIYNDVENGYVTNEELIVPDTCLPVPVPISEVDFVVESNANTSIVDLSTASMAEHLETSHRDDGKLIDIDNSESSPTSNEGNFRELLRLRISAGDVSLKKHLENTSSRATYIGKNIQNELLDCIGSVIKSQIVKNVQNSGYYSIMFDETSDISCVEQLSLTLRYCNNIRALVINNEIHEDFVCFVDAYKSIWTNDVLASGETKLTGVAIGHIVLDILTKDLGLDLKRCVGVATDGCAVMVSENCGAVTTIKKECSIAVYCPCYNHALNNSLAQISKIVPIRNTIGTLKEIIAFFNASAKRHLV